MVRMPRAPLHGAPADEAGAASGMSELAEMRQLARKEGLVIHPHKLRPFYLQAYGFEVATIFDVGVYHGTAWLYDSFPDAHFVLVDPQGDLPGARPVYGEFHATALGRESGTATLKIPHDADGPAGAMASLRNRRDPLAKGFARVETRDVPVTTLDALAEGHVGPFGLKIDTEGCEDDVLAGASMTLARTDFVILEMSLTPRFDGVVPPSTTIVRLARHGLELRDVLAIADGPSKRSRPRHMDFLFTRWHAT